MKHALQIAPQGDREIVMTRALDAPRQRVFDAFTKPELVRRWLLGPEGWSMPVCDIDLRVGGAYRYLWRRDADGAEMGMGGVYREVAAPERLVNTEKFDQAWYPGEALVTLQLEEQGGRTTARTTVRYETTAARDGVLQSDMEQGVEASYRRLEELLAEVAVPA
jgi:uncharacterized protein YndB with AHSA1/START domain